MRLTGERPMEGATPDSLLALHRAGYREVAARLGDGRVLDVGCGTGHETIRLAGPGRELVGIDYSADTAVASGQTWSGEDGGPTLRTACMDGGRLGFADAAFDAVCSSHIIEHFVDPERHVAELARVTRDDGTAFVLTPNRPADFENPFHVYLFEAPHLRSLLQLFFSEVTVLGLEADEVLREDFATRRASGERLLRLDALDLRHRIPRRWYVWSYEHALPVVYRMLGSQVSGVGSGIDDSHMFITDDIDERTPVLFAIARRPRRPA